MDIFGGMDIPCSFVEAYNMLRFIIPLFFVFHTFCLIGFVTDIRFYGGLDIWKYIDHC